MPLYVTACSVCQKHQTIFRKVDDRDIDLPVCCDLATSRILTPPMLSPDIQPYVSPATGQLINSRQQRREEMKRGGWIDNEPGSMKQIARNRADAYEKVLQQADARVDEVVRDLATSGRLNDV